MPTRLVQTVRGPIPIEAMGRTLSHEHVFVLSPELHQSSTPDRAEELWIDEAVQRLDALKHSGIDTIFDLTVYGLGRYVPRVQKVAERIELNIVVATGLYTYDQLPLFLRLDGRRAAVRRLTQMFTDDLTMGIADTGVRAAVLKCASDELGATEGVRLVMRAVTEAHLATGAPIFTHSHAASRGGLEQQDVLGEYGADLSRVVIGHSGDTSDLGYLEELVARGSYIGLDRFGVDSLLATRERVETLVSLCERGHIGKLLLSHDAVCHTDWYDREAMDEVNPNWNHLFLTSTVIPMLRSAGLSDADVDQMLRVNVVQLLTTAD